MNDESNLPVEMRGSPLRDFYEIAAIAMFNRMKAFDINVVHISPEGKEYMWLIDDPSKVKHVIKVYHHKNGSVHMEGYDKAVEMMSGELSFIN